MIWRRWVPLCAGIFALAALAACGNGGASAIGEPPEQAHSSEHSARKNRHWERPRLPASTCIQGKAVVDARRDSAIDIAVVCRAKSSGAVVGFTVSRADVQRFSHHPSVRGQGAESHYGSCRRMHNRPIECQVRINGRVRLAGQLFVAPGDRCSAPISITVSENAGCDGGICPASFVTRQIFHGRPQGC
jgi:hypothetical protein